ncbi:unnamed protein product [Prunus armeniaca]|uniref:Uncharacterized protein n=1 Tax=Prunus armeniaca TaxID=36596 RepID=A0A6J5X6E7_PRUAR|nr:unnamed protein product [Prunus armeniaca]
MIALPGKYTIVGAIMLIRRRPSHFIATKTCLTFVPKSKTMNMVVSFFLYKTPTPRRPKTYRLPDDQALKVCSYMLQGLAH